MFLEYRLNLKISTTKLNRLLNRYSSDNCILISLLYRKYCHYGNYILNIIFYKPTLQPAAIDNLIQEEAATRLNYSVVILPAIAEPVVLLTWALLAQRKTP